MKVRAVSKGVGIPPQKVRLVVDLVRGKPVDEALTILRFVPNMAAKAVAKTIKSAAFNAENTFQLSSADLKIVKIFADVAPTLKRYRARSRGRASPILKRSSHVTVIVAEQER